MATPAQAGTIAGLSQGNMIGAVVAVVAAIISNIGTNLQKKSHTANQAKPRDQQLPATQRLDWWLGFGGVLFGAVADFVALGVADQTIVSALGGGTVLVANVLVAKYWNGEVLFDKDITGVICVVIGSIIFSLTATEAKGYTLEQLEYRLTRPGFVWYTAITCGTMLYLLATIATSPLHKFMTRLCRRLGEGAGGGGAGDEAGSAGDAGGEEAQPILESAQRKRKTGAGYALQRRPSRFDDRWFDQYIYAGCSGVVGSISVLMGGCVAKLVVVTLQGNQFQSQFRAADPWPFFFMGSMVITLCLQTYLLNCAMIIGDSMTVFPFFQVFWIVFSVSGGIVFYQQGALNLTGLFFMCLGVSFLVQHGKIKQFRTRAVDRKQAEAERRASVAGGGAGGNALSVNDTQHTDIATA